MSGQLFQDKKTYWTLGSSKEELQDDEEMHLNAQAEAIFRGFKKRNKRGHFLALVCLGVFVIATLPLLYVYCFDTTSINATASWSTVRPSKTSLPATYAGPYTQNRINSTIGFEKILVLNLPHRIDKKEEMVLLADMQGLDLTFVEARLYEDMKKSGLFYHKAWEKYPGPVSVYRAHLDALQMIIANKWSSALILEDDNDWDIDLNHALQQLHQPFAKLINSFRTHDNATVSSTENDPWLSTEWDVLNLGACIEDPFQEGDRKDDNIDPAKPPYMVYDDRTVADREITHDRQASFLEAYNVQLPHAGDTTTPRRRIVSVSNKPVCMNAYAVSRRGARKLLYWLSREMHQPIDVQMALMSTGSAVLSYSVVPAIMGQWKTKDAGVRNSDNLLAEVEKPFEQIEKELNHNPSYGMALSIQNSIRANMAKLVMKD